MDVQFNTTNPFAGGSMMYGTNFIDIMFRHVMDNGWAGVSLMTLLQFYLYLSLDRIKDMFRATNDKIAEKVTYYMEQKGYKYLNKAKEKATIIVSKLKFKTIRRTNNEEKEEPKPFRYKVSLNLENKVDLMALGSYLLSKRNKQFVIDHCQRKISDRYKTTEQYTLPASITIEQDLITINIQQNISLTLVCESGDNIEILKDVNCLVPNSNEVISGNIDHIPIISKGLYSRASPRFKFQNWDCSPGYFYNNHESLISYFYYTKNINALISFIKFTRGVGDPFYFNGKKYVCKEKNPSINDDFKSDEVLEQFRVEAEKYCDVYIMDINSHTHFKNDFEKINKSYPNLFDPVDDIVYGIDLYFSSEEPNPQKLADYSRKFMRNLITDYYQRDINNDGEKISIYQLKIEYNTEIVKKENPKYVKWKSKQPNETKEKETKKEEKEPDNVMAQMFMGVGSYKRYGSVKPKKWLREEVVTPTVIPIHIKSDRKPFKYLYLPKEQKITLESYLTNFKDNRELYNTMGIPYKGGIILSGEPGCGKSSSILAIATFLNKDIYYLDLGRIKTNEELKLCVDHVGSTSQKGGVIIFEDIDCMTDIVKQRTENMVTNGDELTLSYILNILDGTMAPEDVIFIMTTNHREVLDPALIRPGRMDLSIVLKKCTREQLVQIYYDLYHKTLESSIVDRFRAGEYITSEIILHLFHHVFNNNFTQEQLLEKFLSENNM